MEEFYGMDFSYALDKLNQGERLWRNGWNGKGMYIYLVVPLNVGDQVYLPYIQMTTADGKLVPWTPSQTDILAEDWRTYEG